MLHSIKGSTVLRKLFSLYPKGRDGAGSPTCWLTLQGLQQTELCPPLPGARNSAWSPLGGLQCWLTASALSGSSVARKPTWGCWLPCSDRTATACLFTHSSLRLPEAPRKFIIYLWEQPVNYTQVQNASLTTFKNNLCKILGLNQSTARPFFLFCFIFVFVKQVPICVRYQAKPITSINLYNQALMIYTIEM